ncbi:ATP-dependent 6-phosphofructokinase [Buchnera aphidicola]|uniref:ATP-dependent 6-phosphofructokinase n=1 Tax=Buchnera aphidicola TaxID=9 RepID=UPI0031B73DB1
MFKKIGILTSGGDSPGMNAVIRTVVHTSILKKIEIIGIYNGYAGLLKNNFIILNKKIVTRIMTQGGTILGSSRFPEFKKKKIRIKALKNIKKKKIEALIIIGGNGSYKGIKYLTEMGLPCLGIPGTIDNDVIGTDYTIGYHTALQNIVDAIDKIKDTAYSHQRIMIIEVMGRYCGDLAVSASIACNCDFVILPTINFKKKKLLKKILKNLKNGQKSFIIIITEYICNISLLAQYIQINTNKETRAVILGHIQRGGIPIAYDRILAARMAIYAMKILFQGISGVCIGIKNNQIIHQNIKDFIK